MKKQEVFREKLAGVSTGSEVWDLLCQWRGEREVAIAEVAGHSPVLDSGLVRGLLMSLHNYQALLQNPACGAEYEAEIALWLARRIEGESMQAEREPAGRALATLIARGRVGLDSEVFQILIPIALRKDRRKFTDRTAAALVAILATPALPLEFLEQLDEMLSGENQNVLRAKIGAHPSASSELRKRCLKDVLGGNPVNLLNELLEIPHVREDREIRSLLMRDSLRDGKIPNIVAFKQECPAEDWLMLLREERDSPPWVVATILKEQGERMGPVMEKDDMLVLLSSKNPEVREYALRWVGRNGLSGLLGAEVADA